MKEMKEKIYDARTGMEYILIGDYYLPALKVPRTRPVGRWGMLHKAYLKLRKPAYYQSLLLNGKLDAVLTDVEEQAAERYEVLIEQMSQRESISEKLKEENQMEWVPCKHRVLRAPLEQQVRIEDSHAAIVTPEEFEQAQKVIMLQHSAKKDKTFSADLVMRVEEGRAQYSLEFPKTPMKTKT